MANPNRIPITISCANLGSDTDADMVYRFIADQAQGHDYYVERRSGVAVLCLILGTVGSEPG